MSASDALGKQFGGGPGPHSPYYAAWHDEHIAGPVRAQQRAQQIDAVKRHIDSARFHRVVGNLPMARRALKSAANERSIAARMPRM